MEILFLVGRILLGGYFLMNGFNHLFKNKMLSDYAASKKVPMPGISVFVSGLMILVGGAGIVLGIYVTLSVALICFFLLAVSFKMHMSDTMSFAKNMALLGAALTLLSIPQPWSFSLLSL